MAPTLTLPLIAQWVAFGLLVAGYVTALVFAVTRWHCCPRASKLLFTAILLELASRLFFIFVPAVLMRTTGVANFQYVIVIINAFQSIVTLCVLALIVAAVYVDRSLPGGPRVDHEYLPGHPSAAKSGTDTNPYSTSP